MNLESKREANWFKKAEKGLISYRTLFIPQDFKYKDILFKDCFNATNFYNVDSFFTLKCIDNGETREIKYSPLICLDFISDSLYKVIEGDGCSSGEHENYFINHDISGYTLQYSQKYHVILKHLKITFR